MDGLLCQGSADVFYNESLVNVFGSEDHKVSVVATHLCCSASNAAIDSMQTNGHDMCQSNFTDGHWNLNFIISLSQNSLPFFFWNHFKM